jgi:DNA mismatch repair protein MutS
MEKSFSRIKNYNVSVREAEGRVIFMRKLVRGGSEHSFGIHVAQIAGMPKSIVKRAEEILHQLEGAHPQSQVKGRGADSPEAQHTPTGDTSLPSIGGVGGGLTREGMQLSFFQLDDPVLCQVRDEILGLDINNLTPMEALNKLFEIKKIVAGKS